MSRPEYEILSSDNDSSREFLIVDRYGRPVVNDDGMELVGAPLDRYSITKRELGDLKYGMQISIGIEQLLHPEIGAAVEHTGKFWSNPYSRVAVSLDPIMAVVYANDPRAAGNHVRNLHKGIHGLDHQGRKFNALSPDAFYWAHNTFHRGVQNSAENYTVSSLDDNGREQLQLESTTWFSYYGMPMNMVPADYDANIAYRRHMVDTVLKMNPSAERAITMALDRKPPRPESLPRAVWLMAKTAIMPVTEVMSLLSIGELPVAIRDKFQIPFSRLEQQQLDALRNTTKVFWNALPDAVRYYPGAYEDALRERNGRHKTRVDQMISLGTQAAKNTLLNVKGFVPGL